MTEGIPEIQKTYDYKRFKFLKENRPINKHKVEQIKKSIKEDDQTPFRPILVDKDFGIIDGQHQFAAEVELEYPVYYVRNPDAKLRSIALLNAFTSSWGIGNYLHFYAKQGLTSYQEVMTFMETYHISASLAMMALAMTFHDMGTLRSDFKEGRFVVTHREEGKILMDEVTRLRPHALEGVLTDREFYRSYTLLRQQVELDILLNQLEAYGLKLEPRSRKKDYLRMFEDILNWKKSKNLTRLF
jgi:hypothetical protein